jgi:hypothetical protein
MTSIPPDLEDGGPRLVPRLLRTGIVTDPDATRIEMPQPVALDLRDEYYARNPQLPKPGTTLALLRLVFKTARELSARFIHMKYNSSSGECIVMFRTTSGLVPLGTIVNQHWIEFLLVHAAKTENMENVEEGEHRLTVMDVDGKRRDFTCGVLHLFDGLKLTLTPIGSV